jgi:SSS family solute:Na+ symporter
MYWKRMSPWAGFASIVSGTAGAVIAYYLNKGGTIDLGSDQAAAFWQAMIAFGAAAVVALIVTPLTRPKPRAELQGLVHGMANVPDPDPSEEVWWRNVYLLAGAAVVLTVALSLLFA